MKLPAVRYLVAVLAVALGLAVRLPLAGILGDSSPYLTFVFAVALSAWFGGLGPGLLSTALGLIAALWFVIPPTGKLTIPDLSTGIGVAVFCAVSVFISILTEQLRRSRSQCDRERQLHYTTLGSIGDAVIVTDAEGRITLLNSVTAALTGWGVEEAGGRPLTEVFAIRNQHTGAPVESPVERAQREGVIVGLANHTVLVTRDGKRIPIEDSAAPIRDASGKITGVVLVFRDVSEKHAAELALERSEERLRLALDAGRIGVWDWDVVQNRIEWSDRVYEIFGMARGAAPLSVEEFSRFIHPEDGQRVGEAIQTALDGGAPYEIEFRVVVPRSDVAPQGAVRWISATAKVFRDITGKPLRMLGSTAEIDGRKRSELQLRNSEERFRAAFANAPIGAVLVDLSGKFVQANRAYCNILGCTEEELRGKTFLSLTYAGDEAENRRMFERLSHGEIDYYDIEKRVGRKDGSLVWVRASATVLADSEGRRSEVIGLVDDITVRKQAELDRDEMIATLRRSNEDFERFAQAASHDLRSPLRTVTAMTQILERNYKDKLDARAEELIRFVVSGAERMDALITGLIEFSRATSAELATEAVPLDGCLRDALDNLRDVIDESRSTIVADALPTVAARQAPMVQVFQNLVANAIKYRRAEPVSVKISAECDGANWIVRVADTGQGFDPKYAEDIFLAFRRLHNDEYAGNGIGLATCKRVVERYGGRIWAESQPGAGSVFSFTLPAV